MLNSISVEEYNLIHQQNISNDFKPKICIIGERYKYKYIKHIIHDYIQIVPCTIEYYNYENDNFKALIYLCCEVGDDIQLEYMSISDIILKFDHEKLIVYYSDQQKIKFAKIFPHKVG